MRYTLYPLTGECAMRKFSLLFLVALLCVARVARAEVYKCPDGKGGAVFRERPCADPAERPFIPHRVTPTEQHRQETAAVVAQIGQQALPADYQRQIDARLAGQLKDPGSRQVAYVGSYGSAACGTVNAKNAFGGYVGSRVFVATFASSGDLGAVKIFSDSLLRDTLALNPPYATLLRQCGAVPPRP